MKIVLATGCFDATHPGHYELFEFAKGLGGTLIVGINCDESVRRLKGPTRPIYDEKTRLYMVAACRWVDRAFIFRDDNVCNVLFDIGPDIWVKGSDRTLETLDPDERRKAAALGIQIVFCPRKEGFSTTGLIDKIKS